MTRWVWLLALVFASAVTVGLLVFFPSQLNKSVAVRGIQVSQAQPSTITQTAAVNIALVPAAATSSIRFEIVTSPEAQERGLGGRAVVPDNYGMLFAFPVDDYYGFWMKDMLVPIDMIWLDDTKNIVKIDSNVAVNSYPHVFYPPQPVRYVLETKAGFAHEKGWKIGTHILLPLPY